MPELAIIIPYCGEYPHLQWTLQSLLIEMNGFEKSWEIILIDNACEDARRHKLRELPAPWNNNTALGTLTEKLGNPSWLKRLTYQGKLSHWVCKNRAVQFTSAPFLFFLDAHCMVSPGSLRDMFYYYRDEHERLNGSLTFPISDFFRADYQKVYRLLYNEEIGLLHYTNEQYESLSWRNWENIARPRPCASTCGMICRREHIERDLEFWPEELGPYGGGENYFNFIMARMGRQVHIFDSQPLYHWHIPGHWSRDYMPTYPEWARNIMIATFLVCGPEWLDRMVENRTRLPADHPCKILNQNDVSKLRDGILNTPSLLERHKRIEARAVISIEEWAQEWTGKSEQSDDITKNE